MSYVDNEYYKNEYGGNIISDKDLKQELNKASDQIDTLTYNRIVGIGFDNLTPFQQERVKKAVCYHADFIAQYGDYINMPLSGYSAGDISLSFKAKEGGGNIKTSDEVINLLRSTGLTSRRL
ncbi:hypothetical protein [Hathewaya massiliensis]|uniref:hypothetical protein n=1 Tax=Hathewaya massiliensis TaxID=1964382 RepID=UPI001157DF31|nr:hypothetical protein [Hathewaya massiliensis]